MFLVILSFQTGASPSPGHGCIDHSYLPSSFPPRERGVRLYMLLLAVDRRGGTDGGADVQCI